MSASRSSKAMTIGSRLGHYEIVQLLGKGGMGEVYLAQDMRYPRKVALKLLLVDAASDEDRIRRFQLEARTVMALSHPNIITIFDFGEIDSTQYIATEYIQGETLRQRITRGQMTLSEVLGVVIQVATALAAAHEAKIVHRDVKPENVMIRPDQYVKVLDFGLAKLADGPPQTQPGMIMGTVAYMSPEQVSGETVDFRTDIFSLGVMIYEMITGHVPFEGPNLEAIFAAILTRQPLPLASYSLNLPAGLQQVINKALAKNRQGRYERMTAMLSDLNNLKRLVDRTEPIIVCPSGGPTKARTSRVTEVANKATGFIKTYKKTSAAFFLFSLIAMMVLLRPLVSSKTLDPHKVAIVPFVNASGEAETGEVCRNLTQETFRNLSNGQSKIPLSFQLVPSSDNLKGQKEPDYGAAAKRLGALHVLAGQVSKGDAGYTVTVKLIDAGQPPSGGNDLSDGESRQTGYAGLSEMPQWISGYVRDSLAGDNEYPEQSSPDDLYRQARHLWEKRTDDGMKKAIGIFQQVIDRDPNYAKAYAGKADCYVMKVVYGWVQPKDGLKEALKAATEAQKHDPQMAEGHTSLAMVNFYWSRNWEVTEAEFKQATDRDDASAQAHQWYAGYLSAMGRPREAIEHVNLAIPLDNYSLIVRSQLAFANYFYRDFNQAIREALDIEKKDGNFFVAHRYLGWCYEQLKNPEAIREFKRAMELSNSTLTQAELAHAYAVFGMTHEARDLLDQLIKQRNTGQAYVSAYNIALVYAGLGDKEQALSWLRIANREHADFIVFLKVDPRFDGLRQEEEFKKLLKELKLDT